MMSFFSRKITYSSLFLGLILVYALTLAPDLTWANRGADGGDLIIAAATHGVAHPSGYPTYLILAKIFQFLPLGTLAFRTNLMSAIFGALTALVVADLTERVYPGKLAYRRWVGLLVGLAFGLSPLFWSQAVITEVYTLHAFFVALILWLMPLGRVPARLTQPWRERLSGLIFGLALGNQLTIGFLLPFWLWFGTFTIERSDKKTGNWRKAQPSQTGWLDWRSLGRKLLWLGLGLSIYLTIPLRAKSGSPIIWGNPVDLKGIFWLLSGQLYQERVFSLSPEFVIPRLRNWAGWLQNQYGLVGLTVGFYGLFYGKPRQARFFWVTGWMVLAYSAFAVGYASSDSYTILIPAYMAFGLWIGLGLAALLEKAAATQWVKWLPSLGLILMLAALLIQAAFNFAMVNPKTDFRAQLFIQTILEAAPQDAIVLTQIDEDSFSLWYAQFGLQQRTDLAVVALPLLQYNWYARHVVQVYPDVRLPAAMNQIPDPATISAQNERPVCIVLLSTEEKECPSCLMDADAMLECD